MAIKNLRDFLIRVLKLTTYNEKKWLTVYVAILISMGSFFLGHETAVIVHGMDRENAMLKIRECQSIAVGGMYNFENENIYEECKRVRRILDECSEKHRGNK
jgi:hypothetical protein